MEITPTSSPKTQREDLNRTDDDGTTVSRRRMLTWIAKAPLLTIAVKVGVDGMVGTSAGAQVPKVPQVGDLYDLGDQLMLAYKPTEHLVKLEVGADGIVRLFLHRAEVGQGITTSMAMLVADEMGIPLSQVDVPLRDADPALLFNQLTGGSATVRALYDPVRRAAAALREQLLQAASNESGVPVDQLRLEGGNVVTPDGVTYPLGTLSAVAAGYELPDLLGPDPKPRSEQTLIGTPTRSINARDIVTGQRVYTLDVDVPGAVRVMVRRAPTIKGTPNSVRNASTVRSMPGVIDVVQIPTGVAVAAETFGQAEAGIRALDVTWNAGSIDGLDDDDIFAQLERETLPFILPSVGSIPGVSDTLDFEFHTHAVSHAPLETNSAVADVHEDHATIWAGLKIPIIVLQDIAAALGLPEDRVTVHVMPGGGSFGRRLFAEASMEAALVSQAIGRPVKLMWPRIDDIRHGRARPPSYHRLRVVTAGNDILGYEHRMTCVEADAAHGLGEALTASGARTSNLGFSQAIFHGEITCPYEWGGVNHLLHEPLDLRMNTGSFRAPYAGQARFVEEVMVDAIAARFREDPYDFRRRMATSSRSRAVLDAVATEGAWGRSMPSGHAQGLSLHHQYNSYSAWLVEIDATNPRSPRVTRATCAVDVGHAINPLGLESQMLGGLADGISLALQAGLHVRDGLPLESSFSDFRYAKQRNFPPEVNVIVMPSTTDDLGGAGELGVAGASAAVANAFARATGTTPRRFPINFEVDFDPEPIV